MSPSKPPTLVSMPLCNQPPTCTKQCGDRHRVRIFEGLCIAASSIPPEQRKELSEMIETNGGEYTRELSERNTHLVVPKDAKLTQKTEVSHKHIGL